MLYISTLRNKEKKSKLNTKQPEGNNKEPKSMK